MNVATVLIQVMLLLLVRLKSIKDFFNFDFERQKMNQCGDKIEIDCRFQKVSPQHVNTPASCFIMLSAATKIYTVLTTVEDTWLKKHHHICFRHQLQFRLLGRLW